MTLRFIRTAAALLCATAVGVLPAAPAQADRIRNDQWHLKYLNVAQAHKITQGAGVTVAVIDTGVSPHPDLRRNVLSGIDLVSGEKDGWKNDLTSHGTGMAGLIAAHGSGVSTGALGVAPAAKILPVRDVSTAGTGGPDIIAKGIEFAVARGARIINISSSTSLSPALTRAVQQAKAKDVIIVAAAGNVPVDFGIEYPALLDGVIAVGATDRSGKRAAVSVKGRKMALAAPGVDIYSTSTGGKYRRGTGTSDSAAIVAGAAALVRSKFPDLSADEVVHRLTATATDKGPPGRDDEYGYGVLNLVAALTADVPPLAGGASPSRSPTAKAQATPSLVGATPMPHREPAGGSGTTILVIVGVLVVVGVVVTLLVLRSRRQRPS